MRVKKIFYSLLFSFVVLLSVAYSSTTPDAIAYEEKKPNEVQSPQWSYEAESGPKYWGDINPDYALCNQGKEQSPINIETSHVIVDKKTADVFFNYKPTGFSLSNDGHTIQATPSTLDNSIVIDNKEYKLAQLHFHTPSEHQFNGQNFEMELHFVHKDANNQLAVLGLMIKEGTENRYLKKAWDIIPTEETTEDIKLTEPIDLMSLLPKNKNSFQYSGSLTTPPCSEAVKWVVLEEPIEMSKEQIDKFRKIFPDNHRPVQPINEREVYRSTLKQRGS